MDSLKRDIEGFSRSRLREQSTRVTTVAGRTLTETRRGGALRVTEERGAATCGFVRDLSPDLQVGPVRPFLLLASQDAAQDVDTLRRFQVSHILNVSYGVENAFPHLFLCRTVTVLDLPETDITSYFPECFEFIDQAREQGGTVLLHCNAGVSRSASVAVGYLMSRESLPFEEAFDAVKRARPCIQPNPGFLQQLKAYRP
ncbi:dual specificity protein phosphatase 19b [Denticeps clupeoides]|uniref:Protein-tyrosine-phosphatase n=1 Tax=Denticeps clupeoides TaxID=299321 RepID=A0AAY4AD03_9TELE|nr:dual specificity protein phosphatase 19-like [Denticeps clupeoides]